MENREDPTKKIHDYVTWPTTKQIFEDGRGGLAFPEQNHSNCHIENGEPVSDKDTPVTVSIGAGVTYLDNPISVDQILFSPSYPINVTPDELNFKIEKLIYDEATGRGEIWLTDTLSADMAQCLAGSSGVFRANTPDSLECTSLVTAKLSLTFAEGNTISFETMDIQYPFNWATNVSCDLVLQLSLVPGSEMYIYAAHQVDPSENGVYLYTTGNVRKVADYPVTSTDRDVMDILTDKTVNDNVECCDHYRKSYSHREVYDAVDKKVGAVTRFGVKSMGFPACDGGLIDWFTSSGSVDIGNGHSSIYVNGFGLGNMYSAASPSVVKNESVKKDAYDENDTTTLHPWMQWAYGTRYDAQTSTNIAALPRDWPFTYLTATEDNPVFNKLTDTNNITLVKKGVCDDDSTVGNLDRVVDGEHIYNNRHHIVLYPDYRKITGKQGYKDGAVVVKPLFVHIPAPLDTQDGETVDITMSIQNVDQTAFGDAGSAEAALSGYYAAMAQPRVYVMGGVQLFSNKKINIDKITCSADSFTIKSANPAYKNDGTTLLDADTEVRANLVSMAGNATGERTTFTAHGTVVANSVNGCEIEFTGVFPYKEFCSYDVTGPIGRRKKFMICGMAYLTPGDNPTNTPMGLVSRDSSLHRSDAGRGNDQADLDYYNKFYTIHSDAEDVVSLPKVDKRYLLATVYQTATSTFPWAIANRRKLATLSQSWTDECIRDKDHKSILRLIYEENRSLYNNAVNAFNQLGRLGELKHLSIQDNPISYLSSAPWTSIASFLRIDLPAQYDIKPNKADVGNPVRVANKVVKMLADDFKKMRLLSYTAGKKPRTKVTELCIDSETSWPAAGDTLATTIENRNNSTIEWEKNLVQSAWCSKLRNLPLYITYNSDTTVYPIFDEDDDKGWYSYAYSSVKDLYKCVDMTSTAAVETLPYDTMSKCETYSDTSVIQTLSKQINNTLEQHAVLLKDFRRYAETVSAVRVNEEDYMTLFQIGGTSTYTYTTVDDVDPTRTITINTEAPDHAEIEWMNPFTNIQSIDAVPYPVITLAELAHLSIDQRVFASADAVQMYRYEYEDTEDHDANDRIQSVSSVLPTETVLAKFLESYVAAYSSKMPLHQYQGTRILLKDGTFPADDDPIYIRAISRVKQRMGQVDSDIVAHYINDSFAKTTAANRDPNVDRADVSVPSIGVSAPPYVTPANYTNQTYTRVYMQFTFSQKAGRWYTTDYRQYPTNYLSPLYGADAIGATLPSVWTESGALAVTVNEQGQYENTVRRNIWRNPLCDNRFNTYRNMMYTPYSFVPPMDITLGCVPYLAGDNCVFDFSDSGKLKSKYDYSTDVDTLAPLSRLETPYKPVANGGLGLYPPADVNGGYSQNTDDGVHSNFWSVRKFIRPAVSVLAGTDVPGHDEYPTSGDPVPSRKGGVISDATLYRMFDFPTAGKIEYKLPDTVNPDDDTAKAYLLYHRDNGEGILTGNGEALGYGIAEHEQQIDRK